MFDNTLELDAEPASLVFFFADFNFFADFLLLVVVAVPVVDLGVLSFGVFDLLLLLPATGVDATLLLDPVRESKRKGMGEEKGQEREGG